MLDRYYFEPAPVLEAAIESSDRVIDVALEVVTATFDESRHWRMTDGNRPFSVGIQDEAFLAQVAARTITFGRGDVLRVKLRSEQTVNSRGRLSTRYTILQVIDRIPAPQQIPLLPGHSSGRTPLDEDEESEGET